MPPKPPTASSGLVTKTTRRKRVKPAATGAGISKRPRPSRPSTSTPSCKSQPAPSLPKPPSPSPTPSNAATTDPVYFWRPTDPNAYLGQWYASPFTVGGDAYATAEMWMMVQKARLFGDEDAAGKMLGCGDPKRHKALGRTVKGFDDEVWNTHKLRIVEEGNYYKFTVAEDAAALRALLLATGERALVEASPRDRIWGVGFKAENAGANRRKWGQNLLGKALMGVRARLREEGGAGEKA